MNLFVSKFLALFLFLTGFLFAQDNEQNLTQDLTLFGANEPGFAGIAGCREGWYLGMGLQSLDKPLPQGKENAQLPRAWFNAPIFYPVSLLSTFSRSDDANITQYGIFLQWHIYERFALPALSLRAGRNILQYAKKVDFFSNSVELATSWGFRLLSIYAGGSWSFQDSHDTAGNADSSYHIGRFIGMHWQIKPGTLSFAYEAKVIGKISSVATKLEILL